MLSLRYLYAISTLFLALFFSVTLLLPTTTSAASLLPYNITQKAGEAAGYAKTTTETTLAETLGNAVNAILSFMGVFFMALMVYAGYLWMTARGEEAPIEKAQNIIRGAIIGLIILLASYSITNFVVPKILEKTTGQRGAGTTTAPPGEGPVGGGGGMGGAPKICTWKGEGFQSVSNPDQADRSACKHWCDTMSSGDRGGGGGGPIEKCEFEGIALCVWKGAGTPEMSDGVTNMNKKECDSWCALKVAEKGGVATEKCDFIPGQ